MSRVLNSKNSHAYVMILNWNGWKDTIECLDSVFLSSNVEYTVVVCDNDSKDSSMEHMAEWAMARFNADEWAQLTRVEVESAASPVLGKRLILIQNGANLGFAGGNNVGVRLAMQDPNCAFIWLLNNDTTVAPDALSQAVTRMTADEQIGLCGSTLIYYHEREKIQAFGGAIYSPWTGRSRHVGAFSQLSTIPASPSEVEKNLSYVVGAAMLIRRAFIEQIGLMREDYFLYFEEIDWATRGRNLFRLGYAPLSEVYHKEGASIGTTASGGSALSLYYLFKNRLKFTRRFYTPYLPSVILMSLWDVLKFALKGRNIQAVAALRGMGGFAPPIAKRPGT